MSGCTGNRLNQQQQQQKIGGDANQVKARTYSMENAAPK